MGYVSAAVGHDYFEIGAVFPSDEEQFIPTVDEGRLESKAAPQDEDATWLVYVFVVLSAACWLCGFACWWCCVGCHKGYAHREVLASKLRGLCEKGDSEQGHLDLYENTAE